jgi:hypothetical protein
VRKAFEIRSIVCTAAVALLAAAPCFAVTGGKIAVSPGTISTVVGTGTAGHGADGSAPTSTAITAPYSVRFDTSGNLYFNDLDAIREVVGGVVKTIAGTPATSGTTGDGTAATGALLNVPRGLALDGSNNVYISDSGNARIRMVYVGGATAAALITAENSTVTTPVVGNIYTIAGGGSATTGLATAQGFGALPRGVYVDASGDVYVADIAKNYVRVVYAGGAGCAALITLENPTITAPVLGNMYVIAGNGNTAFTGEGGLATSAGVNGPIDMNMDTAGNLYIAEYGGNRLRKVNATTGLITTIAGSTSSTAGSSGDGGAATAAQLSSPRGIWLDGANDIYIADAANNKIRKIDGNGIITTIAGTGTAGTGGDGGNATTATLTTPYEVVLDSSGNVYEADSGGNKIRKINVTTGGTLAFGNSAIANTSAGMSATISNVDASSLTLTGINISTGYAQTASGGTDCAVSLVLAAGTNCTLQIAFSPSATGSVPGTVAITSSGSANSGNATLALSGTGVVGTTTTTLSPSTTTNINYQQSITFSAAVTSTAGTVTGSVQFLDGTNVLSTQMLVSGAASYTNSTLSPGQHSITAKYLTTTGFTTSTSAATTVNVVSNGATTTTTLTANPTAAISGQQVTLTATVTSTASPTGSVTFTDNGITLGTPPYMLTNGVASLMTSALPLGSNVITASYGGDANNLSSTSNPVTVTVALQQVAAIPGVITTVIGTGTSGTAGNGSAATSATITTPFSARSDINGNLYVTDASSEVRKVTAATGIINLFAGTGSAGYNGDNIPATTATISSARGLSISAAGDVFISDSGNNRVRVVYEGGTAAATLIHAENSSIGALSVGNIYTVAGGGTNTGSLGTQQSLSSPRGILLDSNGNVYIADITNNKVRVLYVAGSALAALITLENPTVITPVVGGMYTLAGNGAGVDGADGGLATSSPVNEPSDMGFDAVGNLYIAEYGGAKIRKLTATTGLLSTVAGTGVSGFNGDTPGPALTAQFSSPRGLWVDGGGNIYIADSANSRIRKIDVAGTIMTVAGGGTTTGDGGAANVALVNQPHSVALDPSGNILIASNADNRVRSVNAVSSILNFPNTTIGSASAAQTVTIANIGGLPITLSAINVPTGFTQSTGNTGDCTSSTVLAAGADCAIRLVFSPVASGSANGTLTVTTNGGNAPSGVVSIQLVALGAYPNAVTSTIALTVKPSASPYTSAQVDLGDTVTFTATVATNAGSGGVLTSPTGTITFKSGSTVLGTAPLTYTGVASATLTVSTLPLGTSLITASYSGDTVYQPVNSTSDTVTVYNAAGDFTLSVTSPNSVNTITSGSIAIYALNVSATGGFDQTITFSCVNPPALATCVFDPTLYTPLIGSSGKNIGLVIYTAPINGPNGPHASLGHGPALWGFGGVVAAVLLWMPFVSVQNRRRLRGAVLLFVLGICTAAGVGGCGNGSAATAATTAPGTYTINVNAVAGSTTHSLTVTLIVQ